MITTFARKGYTSETFWWGEKATYTNARSHLYYATGVGNSYFWLYLDKYMEVGDVLEIVMIYNMN